MGRDDMFPFQPVSPFPLFLWSVVVTGQNFLFGVEWAITIEGGLVVLVDLFQEDFLGLAEGLDGCVAKVSGVSGADE